MKFKKSRSLRRTVSHQTVRLLLRLVAERDATGEVRLLRKRSVGCGAGNSLSISRFRPLVGAQMLFKAVKVGVGGFSGF